MDFKQIEAFINVAKYKSFSKAANTIFLSQPTISSHISGLEKELNIQLFDRSSKEVVLTSAGEAFLEYAIDLINTRNSAISHISSFSGNVSGKLILASSTTPCNSIVPGLVESFMEQYPEVSFNILELSSGDIIENILKFNCELGIIGRATRDDKINSYKLFEDELVLVSNPNLNLPDRVDIKKLMDYKFILRERNSATRKSFENALLDLDFDLNRLNICCEVNNLDTLIQFVKAGIGVSVMSKQVCADHIKCGTLKMSTINKLNLKRGIYLITSSRRTLTPTANAFFNLCKEKFRFEE